MPFDIVVVADRARISLAAALNILISRKTCPEARFTVAIPEDSSLQHGAAQEVIQKFASDTITIPQPRLKVEGDLYRIENKINALRFFGNRPAIGVDADLIFLRPLPADFLFRRVPAAVPEHGLHLYPWAELYSALGLNFPEMKLMTGSGEVGPPWLNAGFISCPDASRFGGLWHRTCRFLLHCNWVPERFPYLDQIALPLAFARASADRSLTFENVLPSEFNQNIFYWAGDQNYVSGGHVAHHHYRVGLLDKYFRPLIEWTRDDYPIIDEVLDGLRRFDDQPDDFVPAQPSLAPMPASDLESFIQLLHTHLLHRTASEAELKNWIDAAAGKPAAKVFEEFAGTAEYRWRRGVNSEWPPGFYHSPVVDPGTVHQYVSDRAHTTPQDLLEITIDADAMWRFWKDNIDVFRLEPFPEIKSADRRFFLKGGLFPHADAIALLAMLSHFRPRRIIEIGSGFSTACMLDCADLIDLRDFRITCIEPYPTRLQQLLRTRDYDRVLIVDQPLQAVDVEAIVNELQSGDFLFIDSTHVLKTGSDVHYELFDILPRLRDGVIIHFHDCPYPFEYPDRWIFELNYSWNEIYALRAFLMYNRAFEIVFWGSMLQKLLPREIEAAAIRFAQSESLSLWLRKGEATTDAR
jgi:hypothetical protein